MLEIRPAVRGDDEAIVQLWHEGWHDAHAELVPPEVLPLRTKSHFDFWLQEAPDTFYVAVSSEEVLGFVSVKGAEVVKLYIGHRARGGEVAPALLSFAERVLRQAGAHEAELLCTAGNARAERFYQRQGWSLVHTFEDALWVPNGFCRTFVVSTHRFRKALID